MSYKWWLVIAGGLFILGIILGLSVTPGVTNLLLEQVAYLQELAATLGPFQVSTAIFIFLKNASTLLLGFIFSPVLCLVPVATLVLNGGMISFISALALKEVSLGIILAALLPHGVLEIPAIIMGEAAALSFGVMVIMALFSSGKRGLLRANLKQNLRYLVIALGLLVPAAIIETFITPLLVL